MQLGAFQYIEKGLSPLGSSLVLLGGSRMSFLRGQVCKPGATLGPGPLAVQTILPEWGKRRPGLCQRQLVMETSTQGK